MKTTEQNLTTSVEIKNRLNPFIALRLASLDGKVSQNWLNEMETACKAIINDLNVRDSLAREHLVNYILAERGVGIFE